jgi:O-methyltransferase involved in polyketide biosynthesis
MDFLQAAAERLQGDDLLRRSLTAVGFVGVAWASYQLYQRQALSVADHEAAFPTAQWVAAMRAHDARAEKPRIGANIGGTPDTLAEGLAGPEGAALLQRYAEKTRTTERAASQGVVERTVRLDAMWMEALQGGCRQFVILAAGLDARAWRLPHLDASSTVYEVDVQRAHAFKVGRRKPHKLDGWGV